MEPFLRICEPTRVTVAGRELRLFCNWRAAAMIEEALGTRYEDAVREILRAHAEGEPEPPPMSVSRTIKVAACLARAAGCEVTEAELGALHVSEVGALTQAVLREMLYKAPVSKKNE